SFRATFTGSFPEGPSFFVPKNDTLRLQDEAWSRDSALLQCVNCIKGALFTRYPEVRVVLQTWWGPGRHVLARQQGRHPDRVVMAGRCADAQEFCVATMFPSLIFFSLATPSTQPRTIIVTGCPTISNPPHMLRILYRRFTKRGTTNIIASQQHAT